MRFGIFLVVIMFLSSCADNVKKLPPPVAVRAEAEAGLPKDVYDVIATHSSATPVQKNNVMDYVKQAINARPQVQATRDTAIDDAVTNNGGYVGWAAKIKAAVDLADPIQPPVPARPEAKAGLPKGAPVPVRPEAKAGLPKGAPVPVRPEAEAGLPKAAPVPVRPEAKAGLPKAAVALTDPIKHAQAESWKNFDPMFKNSMLITRLWNPTFPPEIPDIVFTADEKTNAQNVNQEINDLCENLNQRYGKESQGWHGWFSLQRLIFQDKEFLAAIQKPLIAKYILANQPACRLEFVDSKSQLNFLIVTALSTQFPSFLFTVAPNFQNKPQVGGIEWDSLDDMRINISKHEKPHKVSSELFDQSKKALLSLQSVLYSIVEKGQPDVLPLQQDANEDTFTTFLLTTSNEVLISTFREIISDDEKIVNLVYSAAGASTAPERLAGQSLEVMAKYGDLLKHHKGDHAAVLGYGLVSHALDARHLAAVLYATKDPKYQCPRINEAQCQTAKKNLFILLQAASGNVKSEIAELMNVRLRQMMQLIYDYSKSPNPNTWEKVFNSSEELLTRINKAIEVKPQAQKTAYKRLQRLA